MSLFPKNLNEFVASMGIPRGPKSKAYVVDPVNGSDSNPGTNWLAPLLTLTEAEDRCVGDRHDAVLFLSGDTEDHPTEAIVWDKDYTHLIGLSSGVYGLGQRCRVVAQASAEISPVISFTGNGNIVKNMQFYNEKAAGAAAGCVIITGMRSYFENVFFMAPIATDVGSYSLKHAGAENVFKRCTIGQYTNHRSAASRGLWLHKGAGASVCRSKFVKCEFLSWGSADHVHILIDNDIAVIPWMVQFEDCLFATATGGTAALAQAIDDNSTATGHQVLLLGKNSFAGCNVVADTLTYILTQTYFHGGLMAALAEN